MSLQRMIALSRPRFWAYLVGPYLIGYTIGAKTINDFSSLPFFYCLFYFLIPANLFLYAINDFFDREGDEKNPKKKTYETFVKPGEMHTVIVFLFISLLFTIPLFVFLNTYALNVWFYFLLLSTFYSAPPIRFKVIPFLDSASNMLYILPGFIGYAQISQTTVSFSTIVYLSCWPAAMHLFSAIPDIKADTRAKINTTATYLGRTWSLVVCMFLWLIFAAYATSINPLFIVSFIYPSIPLYLLYQRKRPIEDVYRMFPYINTLVGGLLFAYIFINKFY